MAFYKKSIQSVHYDEMLRNISIGYENQELINGILLPEVKVLKASDKYRVWGKQAFRTKSHKRAPGTVADQITYQWSDDTYFCEDHAIRTPLLEEEIRNADGDINLRIEATELVTSDILLGKEIDCANILMNPNNYLTGLKYNLSGTAKWSNDASDPIKAILLAKKAMRDNDGIAPNTIIFGQEVWDRLIMHPAIVAYLGANALKVATRELIQTLIGSELKIVIGTSRVSSADEKDWDTDLEVTSYIWGHNCLLAYIAPRPGKKIRTLGYTFMWDVDGSGGTRVREYFDEAPKVTFVEAEKWYAHKIVSKSCGALFYNAL